MLVNVAFWFMRHAILIAVKPSVTMEDAKEVHSSLRKAAGLVFFIFFGLIHPIIPFLVQNRNLNSRYGERNRFQEPSLELSSQAT